MIAHLSLEPLKKITMNIYQKDYDRLQRIHGPGYTRVIRELVSKYLKEREER